MLNVSNSGSVVPDDAVEGLFEPFRRLEPHRNAHGDGVGLGLSIVQAVAEAHHAAVRAEANPAGGMTIAVEFPATDGPANTQVHPLVR